MTSWLAFLLSSVFEDSESLLLRVEFEVGDIFAGVELVSVIMTMAQLRR